MKRVRGILSAPFSVPRKHHAADQAVIHPSVDVPCWRWMVLTSPVVWDSTVTLSHGVLLPGPMLRMKEDKLAP